MDITIQPHTLRGEINIIPSKSQAHRLLICAAFADGKTRLICPDTNRDIEATVDCLNALGSRIERTKDGYSIVPASIIPEVATLNCHESGSTLRFLLPIAGALGVDATFLMAGRLSQRPLSPLWEEMERMGCSLSRPTPDTIRCQGKLTPGAYEIDGGVSSQYITGLLFALSLMPDKSTLTITGNTESRPYIDLTKDALKIFGCDPEKPGGQIFHTPGTLTVEGDWSNGAFFLAANALGSDVEISGLLEHSSQGDRAVVQHLQEIKSGMPTISAKDIPDLIPVLAVTAAAHQGAVFTDIRRLRLKESDRVQSTIAMIGNLGGKAESTDETLTVYPSHLIGGTVNSVNDHRIAMAAAIASTVCQKSVTILGADAVKKSYPRFWEEFIRLGGNYELYLR